MSPAELRENAHVAIRGLAAHPVHGVVRLYRPDRTGATQGIWVPGPRHDRGSFSDNGFFLYAHPSHITVLDLPDHILTPSDSDSLGLCPACPPPSGTELRTAGDLGSPSRCGTEESLTTEPCDKPPGHTRRHRVQLDGKTITWED